MRIAVIDLLFSWPPHGGADVDVYYVVRELVKLGHEPCVFYAREDVGWERGQVDAQDLPFPAVQIAFPEPGLTRAAVVSRFTDAVTPFNPDVVFLTQGYFLKAPLILTFKGYPVISRCYAHETACHKDILRFRNGGSCPLSYHKHPETCRQCALAHLGPGIRRNHPDAWTREYLAAEAWSADYYREFTRAMNQLAATVITTEHMADEVAGLCENVHVIPHGVDCTRFTPAADTPVRETPVLFAPGRMEDPAKGFPVLMAAATRLADEGYRFELHATLPEGHPGPPWLKALGKVNYAAMPATYQGADICVVPSIWEEPFGIVALEAMATGLPVCASRVGGLQDIVRHEETGFLFEGGNADELATQLKPLLQDREKKRAMGQAGRQRALEHYQWETIVRTYYPPLFDSLSAQDS